MNVIIMGERRKESVILMVDKREKSAIITEKIREVGVTVIITEKSRMRVLPITIM